MQAAGLYRVRESANYSFLADDLVEGFGAES
jgi:hypothetical protein